MATAVASPHRAAALDGRLSFPTGRSTPRGGPLVYALPAERDLSRTSTSTRTAALLAQTGPIGTSGFSGPTSGRRLSGWQNACDPTMANNSTAPRAERDPDTEVEQPARVRELSRRRAIRSSPTARTTSPTRSSSTPTRVSRRAGPKRCCPRRPPRPSVGKRDVPYNAATDSPINPALINSTTPQATLSAIAASFAANPTSSNPNWNPSYVPIGTKGAQHPVPWQLASVAELAAKPVPTSPWRVPTGPSPGRWAFPQISASRCARVRPAAGSLNYYPEFSAPQRSTVDTSTSWQIETGFHFPLFGDWTGDLYYSRGQSLNYENGYGNDSLDRAPGGDRLPRLWPGPVLPG